MLKRFWLAALLSSLFSTALAFSDCTCPGGYSFYDFDAGATLCVLSCASHCKYLGKAKNGQALVQCPNGKGGMTKSFSCDLALYETRRQYLWDNNHGALFAWNGTGWVGPVCQPSNT